MPKTKEEVLDAIDSSSVKYIRLWFTDILGRLKGMSITRSEIEEVLEMGQGFDGSSIEGFVRIEESDLMAVPHLDSFRVIPWEISGERVASIFCDIYDPAGDPYVGDPRQVLRLMLHAMTGGGVFNKPLRGEDKFDGAHRKGRCTGDGLYLSLSTTAHKTGPVISAPAKT